MSITVPTVVNGKPHSVEVKISGKAQSAHAAALLERLKAVGATAWAVRGQLRLRPLTVIPADLLAELRSNDAAVLKLIAARPLRRRSHPSPERQYMARVRADLVRQFGGHTTEAQRLLIDRIAWLSWHTSVFDKRALADGGLSPHAAREYLAYSNSLERCTRHLINLKSNPKPAKSDTLWSTLSTD